CCRENEARNAVTRQSLIRHIVFRLVYCIAIPTRNFKIEVHSSHGTQPPLRNTMQLLPSTTDYLRQIIVFPTSHKFHFYLNGTLYEHAYVASQLSMYTSAMYKYVCMTLGLDTHNMPQENNILVLLMHIFYLLRRS